MFKLVLEKAEEPEIKLPTCAGSLKKQESSRKTAANFRSGRPEDGKAPSPTDWGPVRQSYAGLLEIDPDWVAEHQAEVQVLDVRQPEELAEKLGHIAGAQCIPLNQLKDRLAEVPRDRPVVSVCHAGMRSGQATVILRQAGFPRVANLRGGMLLWQQLGLPVEH